MEILNNLKNVKLSDEEILRALTDPTTTPFTTYDIEELERTSLITTPRFTPLFDALRGTARRSRSWKFEWNEVTTQTNHTLTKYNGYTAPADAQGTPTRKSNYIMPVATVPKVSRFAQSFETTDSDAMQNELEQKYIDLTKGIEYYLWNGVAGNGASGETDGLITLVTTSVSNAGSASALNEAKLQEAIVQCYAEGAVPTHIFATPTVAQRIANFVDNKVQFVSNDIATNGLGINAFMYKSPFGFNIRVQPVLEEFLSTGNVFVMDMSKLNLMYSSPNVLSSEPLGITQHGEASILYSFFGLKLKGATTHHRKITNVLSSL